MTDQTTADHRPEPWFWEAGGDDCPHGPEPDNTTDAWDEWGDRHTGSPQGVSVCLDAPAGDACPECSAENGEFVPWAACSARFRRKGKPTPDQPAVHRPETVTGGNLECLERECEDFFTDDGDEIPGKDTCSHLTEMEICIGCTGPLGDFPPAVAWADCPQRLAVASEGCVR
ncbi:hypothetical protein ABZ725_51605 [Streptomyces sp. NPDC006872]|uniref:hypothetical protein n=1 Tax=Streptomyces sp. NPDC006872 TaxID=3155720 RepID=UPI00340034A9